MAAGATSASSAGAAGHPEPAVASASRRTETGEVLARLNRAVQRATIYPARHPGIGQAVESFCEALSPYVALASLTVVATRDRLHAASGAATSEHAVTWLAGRLFACGIGSITFDAGATSEEATRFVEWLASPDAEAVDDAPLRIWRGIRLARVDYRQVRFREQPASEADIEAEVQLAWASLAAGLVADWCEDPAHGAHAAPEDLASCVLLAIDSREGTGVAELTERVLAAGTQLATMRESVRARVSERLAAFVGHLAPALRGQLLTVAAGDEPRKLDLLAELADRLPSEALLEIVEHVDLRLAGASAQFISLIGKLVGLSATEPRLAAALEHRWQRYGLPADALDAEGDDLRLVLERLVAQAANDNVYVPEGYRAEMARLSCPLGSGDGVEVDHLANASDDHEVAAQVARISLRLVAAEPSRADTVVFVDRVRAQAPRLLEGGQYAVLADAVDVLSGLQRERTLAADAAAATAALLGLFAQADTIARVAARLEQRDADAPTLTTLLLAGARPAAEWLARRVAAAPFTDARKRLARALLQFDGGTVKAVVERVSPQSPALAHTLLDVMPALHHPQLGELGLVLVRHPDVDVRLRAFTMALERPMPPARLDRLVRQALDDPSPRVTMLAIEFVQAHWTEGAAEAVARLLTHPRGDAYREAERHAIALLASHRTPASREALARALAVRGGSLRTSSRRVCRSLARALERMDDPVTLAAARAWWGSPVGLISRLLDWRRGDA